MIILGPVAIAKNGVIGRDNDLPWDLPEDLQHFRDVTRGKTVLMGRKTYESIVKRRGSPLPKRKNIVITSRTDYQVPEGVEIYKSIDQALASLSPEEDVYVIGGAGIFKEAVNKADIMDVTHIYKEYPGDVYFPDIDWTKWEKVSEDPREEFNFVTYKRK
nr:Dihydrofolate reductase [uncultured bacterium]AIA17985.1 Dihydrofolate reductase [uncultured bacterium]